MKIFWIITIVMRVVAIIYGIIKACGSEESKRRYLVEISALTLSFLIDIFVKNPA